MKGLKRDIFVALFLAVIFIIIVIILQFIRKEPAGFIYQFF
jgi:hypothetical protein